MVYTGPQGRAQTLSPDIAYSPMPTDRHIADNLDSDSSELEDVYEFTIIGNQSLIL